MKPTLTADSLKHEATTFAVTETGHYEPTMYGVTDGKAVGTYLEQKFRAYLAGKYDFDPGNSAKGIDFPSLDIDMKVTSIKQPQSSSPFSSARQKVYGLGYALLVMVYDKTDDHTAKAGNLNILHVIFVEAFRTADYQMTRGLRDILDRSGNEEDLIAFMMDKNLPVDDIEATNIARELLKTRPELGYLTISNALQWRLQYSRAINSAGSVTGIHKL